MIDDRGRSQEADHRFANHLALLSGFVRLKAADLGRQPYEPTAGSVQLLLESVRAQIEAIAHLHRSLAVGGLSTPVDLAERLHEICTPLSSMLDGRITLVEDFAADCVMQPERMLLVTQIVAEVITNAVKHAFPAGQEGRIRVRSRNHDAGTVVVEIVDNGQGFPDSFDVTEDCGLGFRLMRALAGQLGALIEFESGPVGLCFRLTLPGEIA